MFWPPWTSTRNISLSSGTANKRTSRYGTFARGPTGSRSAWGSAASAVAMGGSLSRDRRCEWLSSGGWLSGIALHRPLAGQKPRDEDRDQHEQHVRHQGSLEADSVCDRAV